MKTLKLSLPIHMEIPRKTKKDKSISLGMNWYRNAHHRESSYVKKWYHEVVKDKVGKLSSPKELRYVNPTITYTLYKGTKRRMDLNNYTAICKKFLLDSLVELGVLPDDNTDYITHSVDKYGGYDKGNGRIEVIVEEG